MAQTQLQLEDLILFSRSLTLEEKQELLKRVDTLEPEKIAKLREILEKEFNSFQRLDDLALTAVRGFADNLKLITAELPITLA
ncbi:hypothetical protein HYW83_01180 [Candidatus Peregrinibacteria bacterium]|nr:hypothetical protein [Candidatus Peregrinibacteria bacterium]